MSNTTIYGHSDDCIEIEGGISDEFYPDHDDMGYLHFACGTVVKAEYNDEGTWIIAPIKLGDGVSVVSHTPPRDVDDYTERLELTGLREPVFCFGDEFGPNREWLENWFKDKFEPTDTNLDLLHAAFSILTGTKSKIGNERTW